MKKLTYFLEILLISGLFASPVYGAQSFAGFSANNTLGSQIADGLIQNMVNVTLEETSAGKYSINIVNVAECSFTMGGVTFWFTPTQAGQTAYKTYNNYIQPNGNNREIRIPSMAGGAVKIVLIEACDDVLVDGVSQAMSAGENTLIATGNTLVLRTHNDKKPKISSIESLAEGADRWYVFARPLAYRWDDTGSGYYDDGCDLGTVIGGGYFIPYTPITLVAIPNEGSIFYCWLDGVTDNPRHIVVKEQDWGEDEHIVDSYRAIFIRANQYGSIAVGENQVSYKTYISPIGNGMKKELDYTNPMEKVVITGWKVKKSKK